MTGFPLGQGNLLPAYRRQLLEPDPDDPSRLRIADLRGATGVVLRMFPAACLDGNPPFGGSGLIVDVAAALVQYEWQVADSRKRGEYLARWRVTYTDGKTKDFPNDSWDRIVVS
jgi:hypothetical protein